MNNQSQFISISLTSVMDNNSCIVIEENDNNINGLDDVKKNK